MAWLRFETQDHIVETDADGFVRGGPVKTHPEVKWDQDSLEFQDGGRKDVRNMWSRKRCGTENTSLECLGTQMNDKRLGGECQRSGRRHPSNTCNRRQPQSHRTCQSRVHGEMAKDLVSRERLIVQENRHVEYLARTLEAA